MKDDTIYRQAAIDALHGYFDGMLETDTWSPCDVYGLIEILPSAQPETPCYLGSPCEYQNPDVKMPSAQPTLYGYNIEHLELIARVLQKEDLPPERVVEALTDIGRIVAIVRDEFEEALRRAVRNIERRTDER